MEKLKGALVVTLLICSCFALTCLGIALIHVSQLAQQLNLTVKNTDKLVTDTDQTVTKLNVGLTDTLTNVDGLVKESQKRLIGTSQNLNAILIQAGLASDEVRQAAMEQRHYWDQSGAETVKLLGNANQAVDSLHAAAMAIPPTLKDSQLALEQATQTLADAGTLLADPNLKQTIANVQVTTAHVANISDLAETRFRQMMKPANLFKTMLERALGISAEVAQIVR